LICAHCEKAVVACHCNEPKTLSSSEIQDDVRDLAVDLHPWPTSNEKAWAIIDDHLEPKRNTIRLLRESAKHQDRVTDEHMRRLEGAIGYLNSRGNIHIDKGFLLDILRGKERYAQQELESPRP
jgi:hypothetical protein